ncbi:hypothetical protein XELAEV_18022341mg [Xenopus laevis]|uniref:Uncharacterized protein n=1 Tax=Xenopus laevis TaxID=8355 RepID=A0A974HN39_XENLA|nr:hypothetical protein XELAEV_18022341mg [Xenopus laevis]
MAGVVMMSYTESIEAEAVIGRILALSSAIIAAVNQVLFQLLLGRLSWQETVIFLGLTGVCNTLLLWWIPLTMYFQRGVEKNEKDFMSSLTYLCITAVLFFLFQFLEKVGGHFIPQSGISFGIFLSVFVSIGLDYPWVLPSGGYLLGISAIGVGFLLLLIPENWKELLGMKSTEQGLLDDGSEESRAKSIA